MLELAAADDPEGDLGRESSRSEDGLEAVERDQLADEERVERGVRLPAGPEEPVLGSDEADLDPVRRQVELVAEELGVGVGIGDNAIGATECPPVDDVNHSRAGGAAAEPLPVVDDRVEERDERVEDHRSPPGDPLCRGQVEVAGIADDERVGVPLVVPRLAQAVLGLGHTQHLAEPDGPVVSTFPHGPMLLSHLDAGAAQRGDDLGVPRIGAVVGAEIENAHRGPAATAALRPRAGPPGPRHRCVPRGGS